jgi:hypothetical protein
MKKLLVLLSVVAVSYALQAADGECPMAKGKCDKSKAGSCEKAKMATSNKGKTEAKGCCPVAKKAQVGAKKPIASPKNTL